jgi:D-aminoacyl-tRNA deacylase
MKLVMRALIQRVGSARVTVDGQPVGLIGPGLLVFLGVSRDDAETDAGYLADKIAGLRIFPDDAGKMNRSVRDAGGSLLVVSQFTLYGDCRRGRRPSFDRAAPPDRASSLYNYFVAALQRTGIPVATGVFQASMQVSLVNEGPVTIWIESEERTR